VVRLWTSGQAFSGRADELGDDGSAHCPVGKTMERRRRRKDRNAERRWGWKRESVGCRLSCTEGQVHAFILENSCESRLFMICCVCSITSTHYIIGVITNRKYLRPKKLSWQSGMSSCSDHTLSSWRQKHFYIYTEGQKQRHPHIYPLIQANCLPEQQNPAKLDPHQSSLYAIYGCCSYIIPRIGLFITVLFRLYCDELLSS